MGLMSESPAKATYKRGQVEWALWQAFVATIVGASKNPPPVFTTRIKRLLELDRSGALYIVEDPPQSSFAFSESATEGTGNDASFTVLDTWCLALALDLLDAGFKQKEVTFLMRFLRPELAKRLSRILENPPGGRQLLNPKSRPGLPTYRLANGRQAADCYVFLIIRKVEITEVFTPPPRSRGSTTTSDAAPSFLMPIFCEGFEALNERAKKDMPLRFRKAMVMEIAQVADDVRSLLENAPEIRRGPK